MSPILMRCGRLDDHEPHDWTSVQRPIRTYHCRGHVLTETALAEYARAADKRDPDEAKFTAWVATGIGADPFNERDDHETPDEVFAKRDDVTRRFPLDWWNRRPGGGEE